MRNASLASQSSWIFLAFLFCAALVSHAQEVTTASYSRAVKAAPEESLYDIPSAVVESRIDLFVLQGYAVERFEVAKVLEAIRTQEHVSREEATTLLLSSLDSVTTDPDSIQVIARSESNGEKIYLGGNHPSMKIIDNQLYAFGSWTDRWSIKETLMKIPRAGLPRLRVHLQVLEVPVENARQITMAWEERWDSVEWDVPSGGFNPFMFGPRLQALRFGEEFEERVSRFGTTICSQELVMPCGGNGKLFLGEKGSKASKFQPISPEAIQKLTRIKEYSAAPGVHLILSGELAPRDNVALSISLVEIKEVDTFPFDEEGSEGAHPSTSKDRIQFHHELEVPLEHTLAVTNIEVSQKASTKRVMTPVLGNIPLVGKLFQRSESSNELVVRMYLIHCQRVKR